MKGQKGFTLLEVMVSLGVAGLLLSGLVIAIFQVSYSGTRTTTRIAALENVKNAAYRVGKDVRMAATTNLVVEGSPYSTLVLDWTNWYDASGQLNPVDHHVEYTLSVEKLQRSYDYDPAPDTVARYISSIQFSRQGDIILMTVTSSPERRAETAQRKTYHMYQQPKEELIR